MKLLKHWRIIWVVNIFVGYMLFSSANWVIRKFGEVTYEQIMFHLNMPFASERKLIISYL